MEENLKPLFERHDSPPYLAGFFFCLGICVTLFGACERNIGGSSAAMLSRVFPVACSRKCHSASTRMSFNLVRSSLFAARNFAISWIA